MKQGEKTKEFILETSSRLFYEKGYSSTSFGDIVKGTGLSKGNITYHFKNKKEILIGIVNNRIKDINRSINNWELAASDHKSRLKLFCDMLIEQAEELEKFGCPLGTLTSEFSKHEPDLYKITLPMFEILRDWLQKEYESLGAKEELAYYKAMSLLSKVQGISVLTHIFKERSFLMKEIENIKESIEKEQF